MSILPTVLPLLIAVLALLLLGAVGVVVSRSSDPARHVRGRLWLALGVFGVVLVASWVWGTERPALLGLPIVVGPGAAAAAGVLVFAALPSHAPRAAGARRSATTTVRSARLVVGGRTLVLPIVLLGVLVAVLVATGLSADRTGYSAGRAFTAAGPGVAASGGPYPGWFYGVPILLTAAILVSAVVIAVRRTVLLPAVSIDDAVDAAWRLAVGRTLAAIATAGLLLYLAGVLWAAGVVWKILTQVGATGLEPFAIAQGLVSQLSVVAAVALLGIAVVRVAAIGRAVGREPVAA